jgi:hypothetical protein
MKWRRWVITGALLALVLGTGAAYFATRESSRPRAKSKASDAAEVQLVDERPLPTARAFHMVTFCRTDSGPRMYAIGGQRSPSDTMERLCLEYSTTSNTWRSRASMRYSRGAGQACAVKNRVYVLGGFQTFGTGLNRVEVFNPTQNSWTTGPSMPESVYDFGAAVWRDSLIYVLGGGSWTLQASSFKLQAPDSDACGLWLVACGLPAVHALRLLRLTCSAGAMRPPRRTRSRRGQSGASSNPGLSSTSRK